MDISAINSTDSIPMLGYTLLSIAAAAAVLFSYVAIQDIRGKGSPKSMPTAKTLVIIFFLFTFVGTISVVNDLNSERGKNYHDMLAADYGMTTDVSLYEIFLAAEEAGVVQMKDQSGDRIDVRPEIDGDKLNLYKLGESTLIEPKS